MIERISQRLQTATEQPNPLYGQLTLALVLCAFLTGWLVYDKVSDQLERLTQKPVLAMEQTTTFASKF